MGNFWIASVFCDMDSLSQYGFIKIIVDLSDIFIGF